MKARRSFLCLTLILALPRLAHPAEPPRFEDYAPARQSSGSKARLALTRGTPAWRFRTVVRGGYRDKPVNFAGHYVAIEWGCGSPCQRWAFVDALTGAVYLVPTPTAGGEDYRRDSTLFVADPPPGPGEHCDGPPGVQEALCRGDFAVYYRWTGKRLEELYSAGKGRTGERAPGETPRR